MFLVVNKLVCHMCNIEKSWLVKTTIFDMLQQIGKVEHEEALHHEANKLVMESHKVRLQTTMEKIKCLIGRPKLQP